MNREIVTVWIFCGSNAAFPGAVFSNRSWAEEWIAQNKGQWNTNRISG